MRKLNQKGSFIIFLTLAFALLGTFIGFAVDFGRAYLQKARISRLVDGAALAAAKVLKGQADYEDEATRAACDSMVMNGAPVAMSGVGACEATSGAPFIVKVQFEKKPVPGGPAMQHVQVTGTEPMPTTFLRFLGWMVPGPDFSTLNVRATAQAAPERPVDLMLVLDRSGSMQVQDPSGRTKLEALKCALTGRGCVGDGFLGENFTVDDQIGMTSFGQRGCGTPNGGLFNGNICTPETPLGSPISTLVNDINALDYNGTTNTMEGLRTGKTEIAKAFADATRTVTRKVVLLVTDGQPTALRLNSIATCQKDPITGADLGGPGWTDPNGCFFVKRNSSESTAMSDGLSRFRLNRKCEEEFVFPGPASTADCGKTVFGSGEPNTLYLNQMAAARNAARDEAHQIRELGGGNVVIFVIAIGEPTPLDATARLDANARCLLAQIANDKAMIEDPSSNQQTGGCAAVYTTTSDGDSHNDLKNTTPDGTPATVNTDQQKGKVFIVDLNGDVQTQLQMIFNEIAALLKLRFVL